MHKCHCLKCGNVWISRNLFTIGILPKQCPKCKNPNWQTPRKRR